MLYSFANSTRLLRKNCSVCRSIHYRRATFQSVEDKFSYDEDYRKLGVENGADQETVRRAFLALCKKYHPDSGSILSDSEKFQMIEKAYRRLQKKFSDERWKVNEGLGEYGLYYEEKKGAEDKLKEQIEEFDIKHTAPQHRQYLSWEGVGSGTPSQRQHQYSQLRAAQAADRVREHRIGNLEQTGEALTVQDRKRVKNIKTRYGMERLVEDMIQESMARGEFENLSGAGKPLKQGSFNPYVDFVTHKMNEVMIENGFTPEWITLGREIQDEHCAIINSLLRECRCRNDRKRWEKILLELRSAAEALNKKIQLFNLVVPILRRQMLLFDFEKELKRVLEENPFVETYEEQNVQEKRSGSSSHDSVLTVLSSLFRGS